MSEAVGVAGVPLADQVGRRSERARGRAALAIALQARVEEVSRTVLATWHQRSPEAASAADRRVQDDILRTTELSTFAIVQYLSNGQLQSEDQARVIAATGKAPLRDTIALAELTKLAKQKGVTTIFTESLVSPKVAQTLAREAGGLRTEVLNPLEGLTDRQVSQGESYLSVMHANLAKLRTALGCT